MQNMYFWVDSLVYFSNNFSTSTKIEQEEMSYIKISSGTIQTLDIFSMNQNYTLHVE